MTRQKVLRWLVWVQIAAAILVPALLVPAQTCPNGTLLFKEDFGGNSVDDPHISTTPITAMDKAYKQNTSGKYPSISSGRYLVTKKRVRQRRHHLLKSIFAVVYSGRPHLSERLYTRLFFASGRKSRRTHLLQHRTDRFMRRCPTLFLHLCSQCIHLLSTKWEDIARLLHRGAQPPIRHQRCRNRSRIYAFHHRPHCA